jgi:hypothetical protein
VALAAVIRLDAWSTALMPVASSSRAGAGSVMAGSKDHRDRLLHRVHEGLLHAGRGVGHAGRHRELGPRQRGGDRDQLPPLVGIEGGVPCRPGARWHGGELPGVVVAVTQAQHHGLGRVDDRAAAQRDQDLGIDIARGPRACDHVDPRRVGAHGIEAAHQAIAQRRPPWPAPGPTATTIGW